MRISIYLFAATPTNHTYTLNDLECSLSNVCYILYKNNINKNKKHFKNEQRSRDAAAKKRANTSGVQKTNNYCKDIYN